MMHMKATTAETENDEGKNEIQMCVKNGKKAQNFA